MSTAINRRAILAGAAAAAIPTVAIAAVNASPDHELLMLRHRLTMSPFPQPPPAQSGQCPAIL
jgi:hypothetical protein